MTIVKNPDGTFEEVLEVRTPVTVESIDEQIAKWQSMIDKLKAKKADIDKLK